MRETLTLLHLSDLQFGRNHRFGRLGFGDDGKSSIDSLLGRMSLEIQLLAKDGIQPDLMIVSGDLAETGSNSEFADASDFLTGLAKHLSLPHSRVVVVPGNHDINWAHSRAYHASCEGDGTKPQSPFWPKWKNYSIFFQQFYGSVAGVEFSERAPWTLYSIPELKLAVAGLNSTIAETHLEGTHYGFAGEPQLRWFAERFEQYTSDGWFRIGVIHHNVQRAPDADDGNLKDARDLQRILGDKLNLLLHGHTHEGRIDWLSPTVPIISTGSAALKTEQRPEEVGNQYQVVRIWADRLERWFRRYDPLSKQWIGDTRLSANGTDWRISDSVQFQRVSACLSLQAKEAIYIPEATPIVQIAKSVSTNEAMQRLANLPRLRLKNESHHQAVRQEEQERLADSLRTKHYVWLVADWAQGKDGFLGSAIARIDGDGCENIFRLHCGNASDCNDLINSADTQLGLTFQEFLAAAATLPFGILLLDDLPQIIVSGREREPLEARLKTISDFCPSLRVILVTRQVPRGTDPGDIVSLRPLEAPEIKDYLKLHPRSNKDLTRAETIDRIYAWSSGLPMHLDRLLERLPYLPLTEILADDTSVQTHAQSEPVPDSLVRSIQALASSQSDLSKRSFELLKVLTVLKDGETFETIRRFFPRRPVYSANIDELVSNALIEPVPIALSAPNIGLKRTRDHNDGETPRLLRVPRQVRDYMNSILSDKDREEIIWASMSFFFGRQWWKNVRLRTSVENAYARSALVGPGNEHVIARIVLVRAMERRDFRRAERYARVFTSYCAKLMERDRYRDAVIATEGMIHHLSELSDRTVYLDVAYIHGRALHMTGQTSQAVEVLEGILQEAKRDTTDEFKADVLVVLALCYVSSHRETDALKAAGEVISLAHPESHNAFQAQAILAEQTLTGTALTARLRELEGAARSKGKKVAADNIALDLARESGDPDQAIELLERVLRPDGDTYNKTRAIIEKAAILTKNRRLSELQDGDYQVLSEAYAYCYAQRFGNLLDRCHRVLWGLCIRERIVGALLRLFRYSSFIWRLRGEETREHEYVQQLTKFEVEEGICDPAISFELTYYQKRKIQLGSS